MTNIELSNLLLAVAAGMVLGWVLGALESRRRAPADAERIADRVIANLRRDLDLPDTRTDAERWTSIEAKTDEVVDRVRR